MKGFASKDLSDGRVTVFDGDMFVASKVDGVWSDSVISPDDLKDNFERVRDEKEVIKLLKEAKASLSV